MPRVACCVLLSFPTRGVASAPEAGIGSECPAGRAGATPATYYVGTLSIPFHFFSRARRCRPRRPKSFLYLISTLRKCCPAVIFRVPHSSFCWRKKILCSGSMRPLPARAVTSALLSPLVVPVRCFAHSLHPLPFLDSLEKAAATLALSFDYDEAGRTIFRHVATPA